MTGQQLFARLQTMGDLDIEATDAVSWIDIAQKKVSIEVPVVAEVNYTLVTAGSVKTISTLLKVLSITDKNGDDYLSYTLKGTSIIFSEAAPLLTVRYTCLAPDYTDLTQELSIHPLLHAPMVYYLVSLYYDKEGEGDAEESGLAERYYGRWVYFKKLAIAEIEQIDTDGIFNNDPVETTDVLPKTPRMKFGDDYYE